MTLALLLALGLALFKLGAMSVWIAVLSATLKGLLAVVGAIAGVAGWRGWKRRRNGLSYEDARVIRRPFRQAKNVHRTREKAI